MSNLFPSQDQRSRDFAWRRFTDVRCSAARRPNKYRYYIHNYNIGYDGSHAADVVDEDKLFQFNSFYKWFQVVKMEVRDGPRC